MTVTPLFTPATKTARHPRVAILGSYGTGKTPAALRMATGFGGRIGVVDTYRGAAAQYADRFQFDMLRLDRFNPADLTHICYDAPDQGIDTLVIDGMSPFWSGPGGVMEQVDAIAAKNGPRVDKSFAWSEVTPVHRDMLTALADFPGALIVTVMQKTDPSGMTRSDQREGLEAEFGLVLQMHDQGGQTVQVMKSTMPELSSFHEPDEDLADRVAKLYADGAAGLPLHQGQVRDWASDPARTVDELTEKFMAIDAAGRAGARVLIGGKLIEIGELLRLRARQRKAADIQAAGDNALIAAATPAGAAEPVLADAA